MSSPWAKILLGATSTVLLLFILLPLLGTFFWTDPGAVGQAIADPVVQDSLTLTFAAAGIATCLAFLFGLPLAYFLARNSFPGKNLLEGIIDLPVVIPHTAAGIALLTVFGRHGLIGQAFVPLGLTFTEDLAGIVVAMLFVSLPFFLDSAREAFAQVDPHLEGVARTLGANAWQTFFRVTFPLAWRGILSGMLLMWARGISEFGAVIILAYNPKIIPVLIYERFSGLGLSAALPVTVVLILVALVVFVILRTLLLPSRNNER